MSNVCRSLHEPSRHVIQSAAAASQVRYATHLRPLLRALMFRSDERRVAEHVRALLGRQHFRPIHLQRIALHDPRRLAQRNPRVRFPELQAQPVIHQVIHHPERRLRDPRGEDTNLDPVELIDIDPAQSRRIQRPLLFRAARRPQPANHLDLQCPQLAIGDDQEIAAAARRIEDPKLAEPLVKSPQLGLAPGEAAGHDLLEVRSQFVKEQGLDDLEYVLLGGVVSTHGASLLAIHHGLKQRAENCGRDARPVEAAGLEQALPHGGVEAGDSDLISEQISVDVRESR